MHPEARASRIHLRPRPDTVHVSRGRTVLCMGLDGTIDAESHRQGLFVYQTRMISQYCWKLEGSLPKLSTQSPVEQHSWLAYYFNTPPDCRNTPTGECDPLQETIEVRISRVVGEGMHEDVEVINHTQISTSVTLTLEADADFAARREIKYGRKQQGTLTQDWERVGAQDWRWNFDYKCEHRYEHQSNAGTACLHRGICLHLHSDSEARRSGNIVSFTLHLKPHQRWNACLRWQPQVDGTLLPIEPACNALVCSEAEYCRKHVSFLSQSTQVRMPGAENLTGTVQRVVERARLDLAALRLFDLDEGEHNWKLAAGMPTYLALFGRDMLAAAWQASLLSMDMTRGGLSQLTRMQAQETNDWRDAQPGRMLHEAHTDPLSVLNFTPQALYFGTATSPFLYPIAVSELWHWTADKELVRPFLQPALDTLAWADTYSRHSSGFYKYKTRSKQGLKNQAWKDSSDAIVYPDGSQVEDPLGTCEMQAFAYAAKLHFAETLWWFDKTEDAHRMYHEANELKKRFNERFWMREENYVGMAIDKDGKLVESVASDPGHCVLSGILDSGRVPPVVNRLMAPDMFSGWGVRTLSSKHPAYNPFAYHRGTVWPVENGSFVLGMARYGLHGEMWRLARALFEAANLFEDDRLPEVFGGHTRDDLHPFPCLYERADSPQAWSASVPFVVMQALLGLYPFAPLNVLFLDPWLPDWLPDVTVENLCIGKARVTIRFRRDEKGHTDYEVLRSEGKLHILRQPSPWSLTAEWGDRMKDAITSLLPAA